MKRFHATSEELNSDPFLAFYLVWAQLSTTVKIPDTLLFRNAELDSWLFTTSSGQVKRKHRNHCTLENILQKFSRNRGASDIIAYVLVLEFEIEISIKYLDLESLREYILSRNKPMGTCVVQMYIPPLGEDRSVLRAEYLSGHCIPERYGVLDTFDSSARSRRSHLLLSAFIKRPSFQYKVKLKELLIEENVANRVKSICSTIAKTITNCSNGDVHVRAFKAVFFFGSHNNPTLLWCSDFDSYSENEVLHSKLEQVKAQPKPATRKKQRVASVASELSYAELKSTLAMRVNESRTSPINRIPVEERCQEVAQKPSRRGLTRKKTEVQPSEKSIESYISTQELHSLAWDIAIR